MSEKDVFGMYKCLDKPKNIGDRNEELIVERNKLRKDGWVEISPKKFIVFLNSNNFLRSDSPLASVFGLVENIDNNFRKYFTSIEMFDSSKYMEDLINWDKKMCEESNKYKENHKNDSYDDDFSMTAHWFGN